MKEKNEKLVSLTTIGRDLVAHSQREEMAAKRGLVVELFPFIYEASSRMSARAISRFLLEQHGVKLSAVTITKALADPQKNWNLYFDNIEPIARAFERGSWHTLMSKFLFDDKKFHEMTKALPIRAFEGHWLDLRALTRIKVEDDEAGNILREKWFSIPQEIRLKARPFLEARLHANDKDS